MLTHKGEELWVGAAEPLQDRVMRFAGKSFGVQLTARAGEPVRRMT